MRPIAIIGIGCRFPGGANSPTELWKLLLDGVDAISDAPLERQILYSVYDPDAEPGAPGKIVTRQGGFLHDIDVFDPAFFGIAPREAMSMDPQQRLLLEVAWEALEDAGQVRQKLVGSQTGVFVGMWTNEYQDALFSDLRDIDLYTTTGTGRYAASGRLSYVFDLRGPSLTVDTACSSSLVALHLACESLRNDECDMALAAGSNMILQPYVSIGYSRSRLLSPDGRCKFGDQSANGFVRSEGIAVVVLKPLERALADHDSIYAVIRGSAINNDGQSSGHLVTPGTQAQEELMRSVYHKAGIEPGQVQYFEAHGTGTSVGDLVELQAIGNVLAEGRAQNHPCYVGSIKTNIGHTEATSGLAGLIKAALVLKHRQIPPSLHLRTPNPKIAWDRLPITIPQQVHPWPDSFSPAFAGVNSFGITGTNAHIVLEEASPSVEDISSVQVQHSAFLLTISARSEDSLHQLASNYQESFTPTQQATDLSAICRATHSRRSHFEQRLAIVGSSPDTMRQKLAAFCAGEEEAGIIVGSAMEAVSPKVAFLFTGQGAQYKGMARQLYESEPIFRRSLERCAELLQPYLAHPLLTILFSHELPAALLDETAYTQPALFALEYSLAQLWQAWGIVPSAVLGHSVGEYVAACIAGVFRLEDALKLISERGRLMQALPRNGSMAAIFVSENVVRAAIADYTETVSIAAINGPTEIVISGLELDVEKILALVSEQGIKIRRLQVSHAFHSPLLTPMLADFERVVETVPLFSPQVRFISNLTGEAITEEVSSPSYWQQHARNSVKFMRGIQTLYKEGYTIYIEVGPQPVLSSMGSKCLPEGSCTWIPSLRKGREDTHQLLESLGTCYTFGLPINWEQVDGERNPKHVSLPTYPFQHERLPLITRQHSTLSPLYQVSQSAHYRYPLLGRRFHTPSQEKHFESVFGLELFPFLDQHRLFENMVAPGAVYLSMALSAIETVFPGSQCSLEDVQFLEALLLPEQAQRVVRFLLNIADSQQMSFQVFSQDTEAYEQDDSWTKHVQGSIRVSYNHEGGAIQLASLRSACPLELSVIDFYQKLATTGLSVGPIFTCFERIWVGNGEALGLLRSISENEELAVIHPALLDACIQGLYLCLPWQKLQQVKLYIPFSMQKLTWYKRPAGKLWCHLRLQSDLATISDTVRGSAELLDEDGVIVAILDEIVLRTINQKSLLGKKQVSNEWFYDLSWQPLILEESTRRQAGSADGIWLIFAPRPDIGTVLSNLLATRDEHAILVTVGEAYCPIDATHYQLDPLRAEEYQQLLHALFVDDGLSCRGVLYLWGWSGRPVSDMDSVSLMEHEKLLCGSLLHLIQSLGTVLREATSSPLWIVTCGAQMVTDQLKRAVSVEQAPLWGFGRVIAAEHPELRCTLVDLDAAGATDLQLAELEGLLHTAAEADNQYALCERQWYVPRLVRRNVPTAPAEPQSLRLEIPERGVLDNLTLRPLARRQPGPGEVEIEVSATGLNFRDVLNALGQYPGDAGLLGMECTGKITAIGPDVYGLVRGEEVIAVAYGSFGHFVYTSANLVLPRPQNLSVTDGATIPFPFLTAYHALHALAHLKKGERVLIHAGAGGVGGAAIQFARLIGAEVFATVSTAEKADFVRSMGVEHIFNSRTLDFASDILALTAGKGVAVVLNSLSREFIPHSLSVLAIGGRFVEIGKKDIWTHEQVVAYRSDVEYMTFDLIEVFRTQPQLSRSMFTQVLAQFKTGQLLPLPQRLYPLHEAAAAFRYMAQGRHLGKVVVTIPALRVTSSTEEADRAPCNQESTYLVTGGLGGLGLQIARWLVEQNARYLVLVGRHAPSELARTTIAELEQQGGHIRVIEADVAEEVQVRALLTEVDATFPPLRGIIHAAGILDDGVIMQQSWQRFASVLAPKVAGAWNLHRLTLGQPLDFFVLFSSLVDVFGLAGQSNYAAANAFLDSLAQLRQVQGLAAVSINWGPWAEAGMAAVTQQRGQQLSSSGFEAMSVQDGLLAFARALQEVSTQVLISRINWPVWLAKQAPGHVPGLFQELVHTSLKLPRNGAALQRREPELLLHLEVVLPARKREIIQKYVHEQVARVLGLESTRSISLTRGLAEMGLDSLMAVELRNRLQQSVGQPLVSTLSFDYPTIEQITNYLAIIIPGVQEESSEPPPGEQDQPDEQAALLQQIQHLSDEEMNTLLENELSALLTEDSANE